MFYEAPKLLGFSSPDSTGCVNNGYKPPTCGCEADGTRPQGDWGCCGNGYHPAKSTCYPSGISPPC